MRKFAYIFLVAILALTSCDTFNKVYKSNDIDYKYEAAKSYYLNGDYMKASQLLETMITMLKGGDKAEALREWLITGCDVVYVSQKHHWSESALYAARRRFYNAW